jgi:REP element-mobilizing transposase RayT
MANYNTFIVVDCKSRKSILTTSSARKAYKLLSTGCRIDIWNNNNKVETVYERDKKNGNPLRVYIDLEKDYIRKKQARAEARNKLRALKRKGVMQNG